MIADGQGGLVALCYVKPLVLEVALQARNVQRQEAQEMASAWGAIKLCVVHRPRWSKKELGLGELLEALPELKATFPRMGREVLWLVDRRSPLRQQEVAAAKQLLVAECEWEDIP